VDSRQPIVRLFEVDLERGGRVHRYPQGRRSRSGSSSQRPGHGADRAFPLVSEGRYVLDAHGRTADGVGAGCVSSQRRALCTRRPSQRTVTPSSSVTWNSGSPVRTGSGAPRDQPSVVLPSALQGRRWIATSHDDLAGESQKFSRNLSARVMAKSASSFAAPRRATSRFSDTDFTSSHFA